VKSIFCAIAFVASCAAVASGADNEFNQLPDDGAWAKFYVTVTGNIDQDLRVELTISSVGKVQENGKDCRWIELLSNNADTNARMNVFKLLVPEESLKKGPFGPGDIVRSWVSQEEGTTVEAGNSDNLFPVGFLFPDSLDDAKRPDEKETVDWQKGKLECPVLTGTSKSKLGDQDLTIDHRYFLSGQTPFGLGGFRNQLKLQQGTEIKIDAKLIDVGTGAMSVLAGSQ
jgi:hypothetical protein